MKKLIKRVFMVALFIALVFVGVRFGPNIYARLFGTGSVRWVSERFSETLKEKNELVVYEVETTGQETVTQDAWLLGTVQKVVIPYTFQMSFTVDLSRAEVSAKGDRIEVRIPSPEAGYQKLTVDENEMKKNDWLYPLTPERYAQIKAQVENELYEEYKNNQEYQENAWNVTIKNLETLFRTVVESGEGATGYSISVIRDDEAGATASPEASVSPAPEAA